MFVNKIVYSGVWIENFVINKKKNLNKKKISGLIPRQKRRTKIEEN